mmetsp:Transcript_40029/g.95595  ORF Transcript_40029/g.95595 Transcript_40029/m.95595 type:complete len:235 (-) Transcript_40029:1226-1930(-)
MPVQARPGRNGALLGPAHAGPPIHQELLLELPVELGLVLFLFGGLGSHHIETLWSVGCGFRGSSHRAIDVLVDSTSSCISDILLVIQDESRLGHREDDEIRPGVDGPGRSCQPSPTVLPRTGTSILLRVGSLYLAQTVVAHARLVEDEDRLLPVASYRDVVANHQLHRLALQDTNSIKLAKVSQHHQKPEVVIERADHAPSHHQGDVNGATGRQHFGDVVSNPSAVVSTRVHDI